MAGIIVYAYDPGQDVWMIDACDKNGQALTVLTGTVKRFTGQVLVSETDSWYDIEVTGQSGTRPYQEDMVFADLASALAAYELLLS